MDFTYTDSQSAIKKLAQQFATAEFVPFAAQWDAGHLFPRDTLRKAAQLGFAGINVREAYGGSELSRLDATLIFEALASGCVSTTAYLSVHNMVSQLIDRYATDTLRQTYLPRLTRFDLAASYCLTEPNAGSDAGSLQTTAKRDGDYYYVNGTKAFITGGGENDLYACMVRTGGAGSKGITCLLVEKDMPGLSFGTPEAKLGWHSHPTTMVFFENCRVPVTHRIGEEGEGFKIALSALNSGRLNISACALGGAKACLRAARSHVLERKQFQQQLSQFQSIQFKLADMMSSLDAAQLMIHRAAYSLDHAHPQAPMQCAMAKRFATDAAFTVCDNALQLFGGYGYLKDYPIERFFRDVRVTQILEGSNEIMRLIIAKQMLQDAFIIE